MPVKQLLVNIVQVSDDIRVRIRKLLNSMVQQTDLADLPISLADSRVQDWFASSEAICMLRSVNPSPISVLTANPHTIFLDRVRIPV